MKLKSKVLTSLRAAGIAVSFTALRAAAADTPPNIVYILADDMGLGDVSAYNPASAWRTPHIDQLAAEGRSFTDAHSSSAVCTPSRYSIMTGRYPWRSRLKKQVAFGYSAPVIEQGRLTVAELLRRHGYTTAMIGKWHLGFDWARHTPDAGAAQTDPTDDERKPHAPENNPAFARNIDYTKPFAGGPVANGFESFFGISASLDMEPYVWLRDDHVVTPPTSRIAAHKLPAMWRAGPIAQDFAHVDVLPTLTRTAVDYIEGQDGKKPFFLYLALSAPHTPIIPAKDNVGRTPTLYGDFCVQVDDTVGAVLSALAKKELAENTLVIFAADNGCSPAANFPELKAAHHDPQPGLRGAKADIYEGGHRIPFIVRWPTHVAPHTRTDALACQVDFMATCADLLGATLPPNAAEDSVSLLPVLRDQHGTSVARTTLVHHSVNGSLAIRRGRWKLCLCPDSGGWSAPKPGEAPAGSPPYQLFDLQSDPGEKTNVCLDHPDLVQELGTLLKRQVLEGRSTPGPTQANTGGNDWPQVQWMKAFPN